MTSTPEPARLWYSVGGLGAVTSGVTINPPPGVRTLLQYRMRLDKNATPILAERIEATWSYLGALAWCLKHMPQVLDNTTLPWINDKNETIASNRGVALEYLATLFSLTGLYSIKAKADRDEGLRANCAVTLEHCAQCCEYAAFHIQRHLSRSLLAENFRKVTAAELIERSQLLRLCAQQELIELNRPNGTLHLIRELHTFSTTARQMGMRAFAQCMLADWKITMARYLSEAANESNDTSVLVTEKANYEQTLRAQHYILATARKHEKKFKKDSNLSRFAMPEFNKKITLAKTVAKRTLDSLMGKRAHHLMVTASTELGDLDPIVSSKLNANDLESALFDQLHPAPITFTNTPSIARHFLDTLKENIDHFASSDARPPPSSSSNTTSPSPAVPIMTLDDFAYTKVPSSHRIGVRYGILVERRRTLEEKYTLWPSLENQADLAEVINLLNKVMLELK